MAKTFAKILGVVFILVGLVGFAAPNLMHAHLYPMHNIVHLISGAAALYFGFAGSLQAARIFDFAFGGVYFLLGVLGFAMGMGPDKMFDFAGLLHLGTMDHVAHLLFGAAFLTGGALSTHELKVAHA